MEVSSINHHQLEEAKLEWLIIQLVLQRRHLKVTRCFQEDALRECQRWKAIQVILHLGVMQWRRQPLEQQQATRPDGEGIMTSHRQTSLEIALFQIVLEGFYDLHQPGDGMDRFRVIQCWEKGTLNLHIPVAVVICRLHKEWQVNSRSSWHFSRITIPKMRSIPETRLRHSGHTNHEHRTSLLWSVVIC